MTATRSAREHRLKCQIVDSSRGFSNGDMMMVLLLMVCTTILCQLAIAGFPFRPGHSVVRETALACGANSLVALVCQATRYPHFCTSALCNDSRAFSSNSTELVRIAIDLAWSGKQGSGGLIQNLVNTTLLDINTTSAAAVCKETLAYGSRYLATSREYLMINAVQDIQAWLSSALQFQYDCLSSLSNVLNPPAIVVAEILPQLNVTMQLISNALCMTDAFAEYGSDPAIWKPPPEIRLADLSSGGPITPDCADDNYSSSLEQLLSALTPKVTVSQDGSSNYSSIQEAVDNAPISSMERYVVYIKEGVYNESVRIPYNRTNMTFVGDGINKTILTGNKNAAYQGTSTFQTATVVAIGGGFIASGITFRNTAGPYMSQAVAVRVDSDLSAFQNCLFDGYQDTLYAHSGRQFFSNCTISGTVDFIFGNAAAVFHNCLLLVRLNRLNASKSFVTAQGRTDPGQATGFVFQNCTINATEEYMQAYATNPGKLRGYLGRPWKEFSRTIFISTYLGPLVEPTGWFPWKDDFALNSLLHGEYGSYGPGTTNLTARVLWSSQLTEDQTKSFSVNKFIQGKSWLPQTNITCPSQVLA